ncbi:DegV family protein [Fructilactobacillus florum]|uniref:DegV family protein n=1 Tax=Fructilactobacillus florum DSM 22689 = JCM 16035 TaxID=1423745 RepID=A0A0R2CM50_9LACO|nr:DegV family protein [Fructilactobacillus florum]KRM92256.1 hypothetical protein FC87_GL000383 [Fructilactobacillus florum DSM 22689 = JCM 16035]
MIHIVTDSTAQLTPDEITTNKLTVIPLQVTFEGQTYLDNVNLTREAFSKMLDDDQSEFPKTSQPALGQFVDTYQKIMEADPNGTIISIHLTDVLSGTLETARTAAKQVDGDIRVLNSELTDRGQGFVVLKAAKLAATGKDADAVEQATIEFSKKIYLSVFVNSFDYLVKGGRANRVVGFISSLIRLKPVLKLQDNKLQFVAKCRGSKKFKATRDQITDQLIADKSVTAVGLSYVDSRADVDAVAERIHQERPDIDVLVRLTCPVIMTHVGPGGFAIIYQ